MIDPSTTSPSYLLNHFLRTSTRPIIPLKHEGDEGSAAIIRNKEIGIMVYRWLYVVVLISAITGSNSFAFRALNTGRCSSGQQSHPNHPWCLLSKSTTIESENNTDDANFHDENESGYGLYIHIPYCRQRCRYCDFAIVPIGKKEKGDKDFDPEIEGNSNQESRREQGFRKMNDIYIAAIVGELKQIAARNKESNKKCQRVPLRSIYFGGGTPSLAPIESIESILYHACGHDNPEAPFRLLHQSQASNEKSDSRTTGSDKAVATEITMEMDPGTFNREYLSSLRDLGVNRVSLGVQSFDDNILRAMGRTHRRADVLQAIQDIAFVFGRDKEDEKFNDNRWENVNYSIDLISGCPGLTRAKWVETLQEATAGVETKQSIDSPSQATLGRQSLLLSSLPPPKHISVYDMQIEEGTAFGNLAAKAKEAAIAQRKEKEKTQSENAYDEDEDEDPSRQFTVALPLDESDKDPKEMPNQEQLILRLPTEDECGFMYKYAAGYLRAKNYEHYEVSSYAAFEDPVKSQTIKKQKEQNLKRVSKRSRHNQIYWEYEGQWYACGLGATSFVDKETVARPREMNDYIEWVQNNNESVSFSRSDDRRNKSTDEDILSDLLLKRLRTVDGLDLSWLEVNYGSEIVKDVLDGAKLGLDIELAEHTDDNILRLRDPEG